MPMRNFSQLMNAMSPERRQNIEKRFEESLAAMPPDELRNARELTKLQLVEIMGLQESEISNVEHHSDVSIGALAEYIEALGGRLEIRAVFPDRQMVIGHFDALPR